MAEAVKGINRIILMRALSQQAEEDAGRLAFQTEHEMTSTRDSDTTTTKDGKIASLGEPEVEFSLTSILAQEDETRTALKKAYDDGELVEFWDINKTKTKGGNGDDKDKYPATYYQGYLTEWGESAGAEDNVELSLSATMNGAGVEGYCTLSEDQQKVVQYKFTDTTKQGA